MAQCNDNENSHGDNVSGHASDRASKAQITIRPARTPADLASFGRLFKAYTASLPLETTFQGFDAEIASLPGKYAPPSGEILLAFATRQVPLVDDDDDDDDDDGAASRVLATTDTFDTHDTPGTATAVHNSDDEVIGCVAVRALPSHSGSCELKRLYVTPAGRGLGVGRALLEEACRVAKAQGYLYMRLDSLPEMTAATRLYGLLGFTKEEKYYDTPIERTVFFVKDL